MTNEIRKARLRIGMKQDELARRAGVHQSTISNIEAGKHVPTVYVALMIARALDTSVEQMFPMDGKGGRI